MADIDWPDEELERFEHGLALLGWARDYRWTGDDELHVKEVADRAFRAEEESRLDLSLREELAGHAFEILRFQILNVDERTAMASGAYRDSDVIEGLIPLIDEATLAYYRGYNTAALALLFVTIERCLRKVLRWRPGDRDPTFATLRDSVLTLPESHARDIAHQLLSSMYARYDAASPPAFSFNRHGLLHGLRDANISIDDMNCARAYVVLDHIAFATGGSRGYVRDQELEVRHRAYSQCVRYGLEEALLRYRR